MVKGKIHIDSFINFTKKLIHENLEGAWSYENHVMTKSVGFFKKETINLAFNLQELFIYSQAAKENHAFVSGLNAVDQAFDTTRKLGSTNVIAAMAAGNIAKKGATDRVLGSIYFNAKLRDGSIFQATSAISIFKELNSISDVKLLDNNDDQLTREFDKLLLSVSSKDGWQIK